jgi:hypothetical protein
MDYRVCIVGCAKNIAAHLQESINVLIKIKGLFHKDSVIIIGENDSTDGTKDILHSNKDVVLHLNLDGKLSHMKHRTQCISFVRNQLLKHVHKNYEKYDYLIVADLDNVLVNFNVANIERIFNEIKEPWNALFANVPGPYYDIWALRSPELGIDFDCWDAYMHNIQNGMNPAIAREECINKFQVELPNNGKLIPVKSAFGGLGIYKLSATRGCTYEWETYRCSCKHIKTKRGPCRIDMCEHVPFHIDMVKKGAKLFICPWLMVNNQTEHIVHAK